jgi:omega-hydroxy-beta-dihydromenaquinone-9 sulfotransferase
MSNPQAQPEKHAKKDWSPRLWQGADYICWLRLLWRNRFAVGPRYWYIAFIASIVTFWNMVLKWFEYGLYDSRIRETKLIAPPIFVLGHWRTGTTLLHELLVLDPRFTSPTTLQCVAPCHSLLSENFFKTYGNILVPDKRPMDNMAVGWDRPQEDEFALCLLGEPSTYADWAFPNRPPMYPGSLDLTGLTRTQLNQWKHTLRRFMQRLTFRDPRRLVLKSPPHTARVKVLLEMFPDARFVHIVRDPYVVFTSTVKLWKSLIEKHCLQTLRDESAIREKVFREFRIIYDRLEETRPLFPAGHFHEVRYEALVKDTPGEMRKLFEALELERFDEYRPKLEEYLERNAGYETNKFQMSETDRTEVAARWGDVIRRYGYGEK